MRENNVSKITAKSYRLINDYANSNIVLQGLSGVFGFPQHCWQMVRSFSHTMHRCSIKSENYMDESLSKKMLWCRL